MTDRSGKAKRAQAPALHPMRLISALSRRWRRSPLDSDAWNRATFEQVAVGMAYLSGERFIKVNARLCELLGYSEQELTALNFPQITHPDDLADNLAGLQAMRSGKVPSYATEKRYIRKDGSVIWVAITASRIGAHGALPDYRFLVVQDITARREADRIVREQSNTLNAALESMTDAVFISDLNGRPIEFNTAFATLHRFADKADCAQALEQQPDFMEVSTLGGQPVPLKKWTIPSPLRSGAIAGAEFRFRRTDSGENWVASYSYSPITDDSGAVLGTVIVGRDITARRAAEEALQARSDDLERLVEERTHALNDAKEEAERANEGKTRFLAAASHDLRQPLQAAHAYLGALDASPLPDQGRRISAALANSLRVMSDLLNTLLDMSQLLSGEIKPKPTIFALNELLRDAAMDHTPAAGEKGLVLRLETEDCHVTTDRVLLMRILQNLLSNAIRYTDSGRVLVRCRVDGGSALVEVEDSGVGIADADIAAIFDEYVQLGNAARDPDKGLGLGLSIVRSLMGLLGLEMQISSVLGKGTRFAFSLPLAARPERQQRRPLIQPDSDSKPTILLVDDDDAVRDSLAILLGVYGLTVHTAASGDEALQIIATGPRFDMLISDYRLPGYPGTELVRRARAAVGAALPTVILTGETVLDAILAENLPDCTVLTKPVDNGVLLDLIGRKTSPAS